MTLEQYMKEYASNKFWRLNGGDLLNLLDDAIEKMERYEKALKAVKHHLETIGDGNGMPPTAYSIVCECLEDK